MPIEPGTRSMRVKHWAGTTIPHKLSNEHILGISLTSAQTGVDRSLYLWPRQCSCTKLAYRFERNWSGIDRKAIKVGHQSTERVITIEWATKQHRTKQRRQRWGEVSKRQQLDKTSDIHTRGPAFVPDDPPAVRPFQR